MAETDEEPLEAQRSRALDIHRPAGALISSSYLERHQEVIGVNKNDLEDILQFDGLAAFYSGLGMFLLSGATWLMVDKVTQMQTFTVTATVGTTAIAIVSGIGFLIGGVSMHIRKRGRIARIFAETTPISRP